MQEKLQNTYHWELKELLDLLNADKNGLSNEEATQRAQTYGKNIIPDPAKKSIAQLIWKQFTHLMVYILLIAAFISYLTGHLVDVYVILGIVVINASIGFFQEYKAENAVAELKNMLVPACTAKRNGQWVKINAAELVPGDIIRLEEGDSVAADARVIKVQNLRMVESSLTGESTSVEKSTASIAEGTAMADRMNMLWKGTFVASGAAEALVVNTGIHTQIGKIAGSLTKIKQRKINFQRKTDKLAQQMAGIAISSALILFATGYGLRGMELNETLLISIAALVSAIPEGLPAVLSIVLAIGSHRMAKNNAIIREFTATESLGSVSTIVTDKTGTLTQNTMTIKQIYLPSGNKLSVSGEGWSEQGEIQWLEEKEEATLSIFMKVAGHCQQAAVSAKDGKFVVMGDPTEAAFAVLAKKSTHAELLELVEDFPFDTSLKYRSTVVSDGKTKEQYFLGAPDELLKLCTSYLKDGQVYTLNEAERDKLLSAIQDMSAQALRVLGLAMRAEGTFEQIGSELTFVGLAGMMDPPRPEVKEAVMACHQAGIRVIMATGDHAKTALAIAKQTGIALKGRDKVYSDAELREMDESQFSQAVKEADVFSRLSPEMKLNIAKELQKQGELVAMTGDGVNDAPALRQADVGVSMGIMGTDVARDASMVVLADDNFATIVKAVEQGRIVFNNARRTSFFLVTTNFAEIFTLIAAVAAGLPMPLTATQILWINLVTDGLCDKALATEEGHGDELEKAPLKQSEKILNSSVIPFIALNALVMTSLAIGTFHYYLPQGLDKARTMVFIAIACSQLFNVFNMRDLFQSVFKHGIFSNKWVNLAFLASFLIQVVIIEVPFLGQLFSFKSVYWVDFLVLVLLSSSVLWFGELYKYLFGKRLKKKETISR